MAHLSEYDVLKKTIYAEARGEPEEGQQAVAWVIRNRTESRKPYWGRSIKEVCLKPGQFECWNGRSDIDTSTDAALFANIDRWLPSLLISNTDPTGGSDHYNNPEKEGYPFWVNNCDRKKKIGSLQFYQSKTFFRKINDHSVAEEYRLFEVQNKYAAYMYSGIKHDKYLCNVVVVCIKWKEDIYSIFEEEEKSYNFPNIFPRHDADDVFIAFGQKQYQHLFSNIDTYAVFSMTIAQIYEYSKDNWNIFHLVAATDPKIIKGVASEKEYQKYIDQKNAKGLTPLCLSAQSSKVDCMRALLDEGASVKIKCNRKNILFNLISALDRTSPEHLECIKIIVEKCPSLLNETDDETGDTVFHIATKDEMLVMFRFAKKKVQSSCNESSEENVYGTEVYQIPQDRQGIGNIEVAARTNNLMFHLSEEEVVKKTIWAEARGEPEEGQQWVAHVIKNRSEKSGKSLKDVCLENKQFECWNGKSDIDTSSEPIAYASIGRWLPSLLKSKYDPTNGCRHYNNPAKEHPDWAKKCTKIRKIGSHQFYKD